MPDQDLDQRIAALMAVVADSAPAAPPFDELPHRISRPAGQSRRRALPVVALAAAVVVIAAVALWTSRSNRSTVNTAGAPSARFIPASLPPGLQITQARDLSPSRYYLGAPMWLYGRSASDPASADLAVVVARWSSSNRGGFVYPNLPSVTFGGKTFTVRPVGGANLTLVGWSPTPTVEIYLLSDKLPVTELETIGLHTTVANGAPVLTSPSLLPAGDHVIATGDSTYLLFGIVSQGGTSVAYHAPSGTREGIDIVTSLGHLDPALVQFWLSKQTTHIHVRGHPASEALSPPDNGSCPLTPTTEPRSSAGRANGPSTCATNPISISLLWQERPDLLISLDTVGLSEAETKAIAESLGHPSNAQWSHLLSETTTTTAP